MFTISELGTQATIARFKSELRLFKREQRIQMRKAGNLIKRAVIQKVKAEFRKTRPRGSGREAKLGPLEKKIRLRVFSTKADVGARIEPNRLAFYSRYLETGLSTTVTRKAARNVYIGGRFVRLKAGTYQLRIPRKPFLEPVAKETEPRVVELMGESYGVFYRGGGGA